MGRVEERRLRELERRAQKAAERVATQRLPDGALAALTPWYGRCLEADAAGEKRPWPTPEEHDALLLWLSLQDEAYAQGWGRPTDPGLGQPIA